MSLVNYNDLMVAYRKAKVDLFYMGNPRRIDLLNFEIDLEKNLKEIENRYAKKDKDFFLGKEKPYWYSPKSIKIRKEDDKNKVWNKPVFSNPDDAHSVEDIEYYELRITERLPIAFHVLTTLWINTIGEQFDSVLSKNSYGNRINRRGTGGNINLHALGSFERYLFPYSNWLNKGFEAIRTALNNNKKVIAITADFASFYHNVDPRFIQKEDFRNKLGLTIKGNEVEQEEKIVFTNFVVDLLQKWAEKTPLKHGLPVGCAISSVIANVALAFLDKSIEKELVPLYYGRYVDDIILVVENTCNFTNSKDVWNWIMNRVKCLSFKPVDNKEKTKQKIVFDIKSSRTHNNNVSFGNLYFQIEKTKVLLLDYPSGIDFLDSLEFQIRIKSSEWRLIPELPAETYIARMLLSACSKSGEEVDNLREADSLSMRRAIFAMKLSDFESYSRNLEPIIWKTQRTSFLETIQLHFTKNPLIFELFKYYSRILSIATKCEEYKFIKRFIAKIFEECRQLEQIQCKLSGFEFADNLRTNEFDLFIEYISNSFYESIVSSLSSVDQTENILEILDTHNWWNTFMNKSINELYNDLFMYDLANIPYRYSFLYSSKPVVLEDQNNKQVQSNYYSNEKDMPPFLFKYSRVLLQLGEMLEFKTIPAGCIPKAWLFPTRPFHLPELYAIIKNPLSVPWLISDVLMFQRGYSQQGILLPKHNSDIYNKKYNICSVLNSKISSSATIALTSWKTENSSWIAAARGERDPDVSRYPRLVHLLNQILQCHRQIDYLVFPELSIPLRWFLAISDRLRRNGISLIAGVEYIHNEQNTVSNQVWCSLIHDGLGFPQSVIIKHNKDFPAIHEKLDLQQYAGKTFHDEQPHPYLEIIKHGDFYFGILICSELTNIDYRARFRGNVDAVFVPEWNPDTAMFASLIEAAAYDVHAYIIQCNDRQYGDTRIRIPAKDHYSRDIVKIKGGEEDYFVVGKIDIDKLRKFQSCIISPIGKEAPFKPVPAGFQIAHYRDCLPENTQKKE